MAKSLRLLCALLLLIFVQGNCQRCTLSSVEILQTNTGLMVRYDPVFEVEVRNLCKCTLKNVYLYSEGFGSTVAVDPKLFRRDGAGYLLGDGRGIPSSKSVKFRYAWDRAFSMKPASLQDDCTRESETDRSMGW